MKLNHFYKFLFYINLFTFLFILKIHANEDISERVKKLTLELRCMTCQNQSIYESEADFSNDIKKIVRTKIEEGKSDMEIKKFLSDRYGEYILFKPLFDYKNLFLWLFPFIMLVFGLFFILSKTRKK